MRFQIEVELGAFHAADGVTHLEILEVLGLKMREPVRELLGS